MNSLHTIKQLVGYKPSSDKMPALFVGHGNPMNALWNNSFTRHLSQLGQLIEKPKAIMVVSAHWLSKGTQVSINPKPETIYDFGGFPQAMYEIKYPALGAPDVAKDVSKEVKFTHIHEVDDMGLDHGTWTILKFIYPKADIPVFQLSIDISQVASYHFNLAKELQFLRTRGVLVLGSGNIVHNLRQADFHNANAPVFDWASEFDEHVKEQTISRNFKELLTIEKMGSVAKLAVPTPDHYLPLMYTLGMIEDSDRIEFTHESIQHGSISMRTLLAY